MAVTVLAPSEDSGRVTPTLKTGRRRLAVQPAPGKVDVDQEPPSPLSHRGILARHATFAPRSEAEKAFGSPIPVSPGARAPPVDAASPRPQRAKPTKNTPTQPRRKFSFPKMGFFSSKTKPRDSTSGQGSPGPRRGPLALRRADALLAPRDPSDPRITLVLDLDETLVRSSFDAAFAADFEAPFTLNGARCTARVRKRPFVDEFLKRVSQKYELVVMTAGVKPYAKLVLDLLDKHGVLKARFYRESCTKTATGLLVKDLGRLNRDLKRTIVVDNSPNAYLWHPEHAIDVSDFVGDPQDEELAVLADFLDIIHDVDDVRRHVARWRDGGAYAMPRDATAGAAARAEKAAKAKK
mmetsp:Transcript_13122/g.34831  ORF Transcript_13122/g.34831 Transcript_13122/m.34831 type:complete len:352 (+) Transcript_13122:417-1472(+)